MVLARQWLHVAHRLGSNARVHRRFSLSYSYSCSYSYSGYDFSYPFAESSFILNANSLALYPFWRSSMTGSFRTYFDHEKLEVYQEAITFIAWLEPVLESLPKSRDARDHLDRASTSVVLNIAEGNGKYSLKDRARSFDIANGSALECAAVLDV
jgi:hypothetical protein